MPFVTGAAPPAGPPPGAHPRASLPSPAPSPLSELENAAGPGRAHSLPRGAHAGTDGRPPAPLPLSPPSDTKPAPPGPACDVRFGWEDLLADDGAMAMDGLLHADDHGDELLGNASFEWVPLKGGDDIDDALGFGAALGTPDDTATIVSAFLDRYGADDNGWAAKPRSNADSLDSRGSARSGDSAATASSTRHADVAWFDAAHPGDAHMAVDDAFAPHPPLHLAGEMLASSRRGSDKTEYSFASASDELSAGTLAPSLADAVMGQHPAVVARMGSGAVAAGATSVAMRRASLASLPGRFESAHISSPGSPHSGSEPSPGAAPDAPQDMTVDQALATIARQFLAPQQQQQAQGHPGAQAQRGGPLVNMFDAQVVGGVQPLQPPVHAPPQQSAMHALQHQMLAHAQAARAAQAAGADPASPSPSMSSATSATGSSSSSGIQRPAFVKAMPSPAPRPNVAKQGAPQPGRPGPQGQSAAASAALTSAVGKLRATMDSLERGGSTEFQRAGSAEDEIRRSAMLAAHHLRATAAPPPRRGPCTCSLPRRLSTPSTATAPSRNPSTPPPATRSCSPAPPRSPWTAPAPVRATRRRFGPKRRIKRSATEPTDFGQAVMQQQGAAAAAAARRGPLSAAPAAPSPLSFPRPPNQSTPEQWQSALQSLIATRASAPTQPGVRNTVHVPGPGAQQASAGTRGRSRTMDSSVGAVAFGRPYDRQQQHVLEAIASGGISPSIVSGGPQQAGMRAAASKRRASVMVGELQWRSTRAQSPDVSSAASSPAPTATPWIQLGQSAASPAPDAAPAGEDGAPRRRRRQSVTVAELFRRHQLECDDCRNRALMGGPTTGDFSDGDAGAGSIVGPHAFFHGHGFGHGKPGRRRAMSGPGPSFLPHTYPTQPSYPGFQADQASAIVEGLLPLGSGPAAGRPAEVPAQQGGGGSQFDFIVAAVPPARPEWKRHRRPSSLGIDIAGTEGPREEREEVPPPAEAAKAEGPLLQVRWTRWLSALPKLTYLIHFDAQSTHDAMVSLFTERFGWSAEAAEAAAAVQLQLNQSRGGAR
ncbi:hypothetical protein DFJ74DRAFT_502684 [Hyaloraphidium curvatum]|nr:hypothetical protein DFJ74DRAFT_502684 [Hyaloraphidium curvatum]